MRWWFVYARGASKEAYNIWRENTRSVPEVLVFFIYFIFFLSFPFLISTGRSMFGPVGLDGGTRVSQLTQGQSAPTSVTSGSIQDTLILKQCYDARWRILSNKVGRSSYATCWLLYHDNASSHMSLCVREFLAKHNMTTVTLQLQPTSFCSRGSRPNSKDAVLTVFRLSKKPW